MKARSKVDVEAMLTRFPDLLDLYPLEKFLTEVLRQAVALGDGDVAGCYVPIGLPSLAAWNRKGLLLDPIVNKEAKARLDEAAAAGAVDPRICGSGSAARLLQSGGPLQAVPCPILTRPVGHLLLRHVSDDDALAALSRLVGFYLHRHEIESKIDAMGRSIVIMGCCPEIFKLQEDLERFAPLCDPVLILGESGSGKEILATAIHVLSPRAAGPFVSVNCAGAPTDNLLQDEFFGHRRGAFTGADFDKDGCCQEADGGTLFLDEIGDMSHELQGLLLRTLTTGEIRRLGDRRTTHVDFRLVSATHHNPLQEAAQQRFRPDLYYRISAFQLRIPPLRDRRRDLRLLGEYILWQFARQNHLSPKHLHEEAKRKLENHPWPGNIRELENVLKRAFVMAPGSTIDCTHLHLDTAMPLPCAVYETLLQEIKDGKKDFWTAVYRPFMHRDLTRAEVALLLDCAWQRCGGNLKNLAKFLSIDDNDYPRFVAFLHRHQLRNPATGGLANSAGATQ